MSNLFEKLKNRQDNFNDIEQIATSLKNSEKRFSVDERMWKPTVDASGVGQAVIRFLPSPDPDKQPFTLYFNHSFKNPVSGKWFIEKCPTSIGRKDCKVCRENTLLWNTGIESKKALASSRKRNYRYVANIFVVSDPKNPEKEGKVFLFAFGPKIFQMLKSCVEPEFEDQPRFNPFNLWSGANFRMKIKPVKKQRSYDASTFDVCSPFGNDEQIAKVCEQLYSLDEFLDPSTYLTDEEMTKKYNDVMFVSAEPRETEGFDEVDQNVSTSNTAKKYDSFLSKFKEPALEDDDDIPF